MEQPSNLTSHAGQAATGSEAKPPCQCRAAQREQGVVSFRKKPVVIEAVRVNATDYNGSGFDGFPFDAMPRWLSDALLDGTVSVHRSHTDYAMWQIKTLEDGPNGEAKHIAGPGDWIIRGIKGELYFCKSDIFEALYEPATGAAS